MIYFCGMELLELGAIDIGSNAGRLLVSHVLEGDKPFFKKGEMVRVPLRLGFDTFENGELSAISIDRLLHTISAFKHLMSAYNVQHYLAFATSAMRDARNGEEVVNMIKEKTGVRLEIISGQREAELLYANNFFLELQMDNAYLFIDVGGGSTEVTIMKGNMVLASRSFQIGTIRLLKEMVGKRQWDEMIDWVATQTKVFKSLTAVGTGGNINKVFKMTEKPVGTPLSLKKLKQMLADVQSLSMEERVRILNMNPDRADVVAHALRIYTSLMAVAHCSEILIPKTGLADGMTRVLYEQVKRQKQLTLEW